MRADLIKTLRTRKTQRMADEVSKLQVMLREPRPQYPRTNFTRILNGDWDIVFQLPSSTADRSAQQVMEAQNMTGENGGENRLYA